MTRPSFTYDLPMASSSSPHCPVRSQKRDSRAADVARLLDPSYTHGSSSSHRHSSSLNAPRSFTPSSIISSAYVDTDGDLHDPDYRDFPTLVVDEDNDDFDEDAPREWAPAAFAHERKRRLTEASSSHYSPHYSPNTYGSLPNTSPAIEQAKPAKEHTSFVHRYRCRGSSTSTTPSILLTPPPRTFDSLSSESYLSNVSTSSLPQYIDNSLLSTTEKLTRTTTTVESSTCPKHEHEHTHRDSLKRQWQAVSLRVRFGVFRAGRRWGIV